MLGLIPQVAHAETMSAPFEGADIIILGEVHDNPQHHINQARIVSEVQPAAIVFEMITPDVARQVTPEIRENAILLEATLSWEDSGWPDFAMYYPIFAAAPDAAIFGGAMDRAEVRRTISDGAAEVFGASAALFGLDADLPDDQLEKRLQLQQDAHCGALPVEMLPGMVEAQRVRDAALARAAVAAHAHAQASEGGPVVVITGNGHAREDWGMPAALRAYFADREQVDIRTLAQFEQAIDQALPVTTTLVTDPAERDDPCKAFAK